MGERRIRREDRELSRWRLDAPSQRRHHDHARDAAPASAARFHRRGAGTVRLQLFLLPADVVRLPRLDGPAPRRPGDSRFHTLRIQENFLGHLIVIQTYDAVVVGAGPYGLSTAAHLIGRGLTVAIFGKPLELWRNHMPKGMRLRSHWWATSLSDPRNGYGFERFFRETKYKKCYPEPIDAFIDYGLWFRQHVIPEADETYVSRIERDHDRFLVTLADGRQIESAAVVMAIGL